MVTGLHHSNDTSSRAGRSRRLASRMIAAIAPLAAVSLSWSAPAPAPRAVERIDATSVAGCLQLDLVTTSPFAPSVTVFSLRDPDRLVMDIPYFVWKPGATALLPSAGPAISRIRIGQATLEPPVTRVVLDLASPARQFCYRSSSSTAHGNLRVDVAERASSAETSGWTPVTSAGSYRLPTRTDQPAVRAARAERATPSVAATHRVSSPPDTAVASTGTTVSRAAGAQTVTGAPLPAAAGPAGSEPTAAGLPAGSEKAPSSSADSPTFRASRAARLPSRPAAPGSERHPLRVVAALALVILTGIIAAWARRRVQSASRRDSGAVPASAEPDSGSTTDQTTGSGASADGVRCRIVEGYLVLQPEQAGAPLTGESASTRATIAGGTLELDFSGSARGEEKQEQPAADDTPETSTRVSDLIASLSDDNVGVRRAAAEGLLEIAAAGHSRALLPHLSSADPKVRSVVAGILGDAGAMDCLPEVARLADDPEPSVRACVMYAFGQCGEKAHHHAAIIRGRLSDSDASVRASAVEALAAVSPRSEGAAEEVIHFTADPDALVRQAAASATFGYALRGVVEPLIGLLADFSRRAQSLEVLQQADDAVLWRLLIAFRSSASDRAQAAMDALSYVMSRRWTVDDFREEIASPDAEARLTGVEGLGMIGGEEAVACLLRLVQSDPSDDVRKRASEILDQWKSWSASPSQSDSQELQTRS